MNPLRPLILGLIAASATSLLLAMPIPYPSADPGELLDWWTVHGTPTATIALLRLGMLAFTIWVSAAGVLAALAATLQVQRPDRMTRWLPAALRRWLVGAAVASMVAAPTVASAAPGIVPTPSAESTSDIVGGEDRSSGFVLVDRGAATNEILITEAEPRRSGQAAAAGPLDAAAVTAARSADPLSAQAPPPQTDRSGASPGGVASSVAEQADLPPGEPAAWTVQHGDHLWAIAAEIVGRRASDADIDEVWRYWRALIADNEAVLDSNPDLIHPGTRLSLPSV